jgi:hypothetical protein
MEYRLRILKHSADYLWMGVSRGTGVGNDGKGCRDRREYGVVNEDLEG